MCVWHKMVLKTKTNKYYMKQISWIIHTYIHMMLQQPPHYAFVYNSFLKITCEKPCSVWSSLIVYVQIALFDDTDYGYAFLCYDLGIINVNVFFFFLDGEV